MISESVNLGNSEDNGMDAFAFPLPEGEEEQARRDRAKRERFLPTGRYITVTPVQTTATNWEQKGQWGDTDYRPARLSFSCFASVRDRKAVMEAGGAGAAGDVPIVGSINIRWSPEFQETVDRRSGQKRADSQYQTYVDLCDVVTQATGAAPKTPGEIAEYLRNYPLDVLVILTKTPSNFVKDIRAIKD